MSSLVAGARLRSSSLPGRPTGKGVTRLLRLVLAAHGPLWPPEMVRLTGFSSGQVQDARDRLARRGEIEAIDQRQRGHLREKRWRLSVGRLQEVDLQSPGR